MTSYEMLNRASGCAIDVWMQRNSGGASSHGGTAPSLIETPSSPAARRDVLTAALRTRKYM